MTFSLDRTIEIRARRATVFRFFTDSARWARWWGEGSTIDAAVGGAVRIVYPGGTRASGVVREIVPDERIAFTYGYEAPGASIPPGGSLVTITLEDRAAGTRLVLRHDVDTAAVRDDHVQGWRYQLSRFAFVVGDEAHAGAGDAIAAWFTAWTEPDADRRRAALAAWVAPDVRFRDPNGDVYDLDELVIHIGAALRFMPGVKLEPRGKPRRVHDVALVDWAAVKPDGATAMTGTNVVRFASDGKITEVVGVPA
jgi:uncharacterized protein YndB with AHSA1/START domain